LRGFLPCAVAQGKGLASSEADTLTTAPSSDVGSAISLSEYLESLKSGDTVLVGLVVSRDHLVPSGAQDLDRTAVDADVFVGHEALVEAHALGSCAGGAEASGQGLHFRAESLLEPQSVGAAVGDFLAHDALAWQVDGVLVRDVVGPGSCGIQVAATGKGKANGGACGGAYSSRAVSGSLALVLESNALAGDFQRVAGWEVPYGEDREAVISAAGSTGEASAETRARDVDRVAAREALLAGTIEVEAGDGGSSAGGDQREAVGNALLGRCREVVGGAAGSSVGRHRRRHLG
jgi:hypothetical protein